MKKCKVYIVGAGPGDPELITVKAGRLLGEADVVIYDRLVSEELLGYIRSGAERIFVGKEIAFHSIPQDDINRLIIEKAKGGKKVVRLKGGDPYIFGRGSEEAQALSEAGIPFEVVPGITAASGLASYAGIPLTDRRLSSAVTFITGHKTGGGDLSAINWDALAALNHTLVFYMGIKNLKAITSNLMEHGFSPLTPAAVVRRATLPDQKTVTGALSDIAELTYNHNIHPPALLIVGEVVNLRESLAWFKEKHHVK